MFGGDFKASRHMVFYQFAVVAAVGVVNVTVSGAVHGKVIAYTGTDK